MNISKHKQLLFDGDGSRSKRFDFGGSGAFFSAYFGLTSSVKVLLLPHPTIKKDGRKRICQIENTIHDKFRLRPS